MRQRLQCLLIAFRALALIDDRAVPVQMVGVQGDFDRIDRAWFVAWQVKIVDS